MKIEISGYKTTKLQTVGKLYLGKIPRDKNRIYIDIEDVTIESDGANYNGKTSSCFNDRTADKLIQNQMYVGIPSDFSCYSNQKWALRKFIDNTGEPGHLRFPNEIQDVFINNPRQNSINHANTVVRMDEIDAR